jgi:hypothetical protein
MNDEICSVPPQASIPVRAIRLLMGAYDAAADEDGVNWDFALPYRLLRSAGLTPPHAEALLKNGYVTQRVETSRGPARRTFALHLPPTLHPRSCLMLTAQGVAFASKVLVAQFSLRAAEPALASLALARRPFWEEAMGRLWFRGLAVKHVRHDAANQRCVLRAFQRQAWEQLIEDPLPRDPGIMRKKRRLQTVKALNQRQSPRTIRFYTDGNGRIGWVMFISS